jgi:hypothetical protein
MKPHFKKYLSLSSLLFTLFGTVAIQTAGGATCRGELAKPSCKSMAFIVSGTKDACTEYYETTSGVSQQCIKNEKKHNKCISDPKALCTPPKPETK